MKTEIDHGNLIQPFLEVPHQIEKLYVAHSEPILLPIANPVKAVFTFTETNLKGIVVQSSVYTHYYYAGKKPKAFPLLTNALLRSTNEGSLLAIAFVQSWGSLNLAGKFFKNAKIIEPVQKIEHHQRGIGCYWSERKMLTSKYAENEIVSFGNNLELEPKPEMQSTILAIFINQNHCPDWFTFDGIWEDECQTEFELKDNLLQREKMKVNVKQHITLKLSTGFIFEQEIDLLRELVASEIVFLKINEQWKKTIPISQKTISYDKTKNVFSQIVEFRVLQDN